MRKEYDAIFLKTSREESARTKLMNLVQQLDTEESAKAILQVQKIIKKRKKSTETAEASTEKKSKKRAIIESSDSSEDEKNSDQEVADIENVEETTEDDKNTSSAAKDPNETKGSKSEEVADDSASSMQVNDGRDSRKTSLIEKTEVDLTADAFEATLMGKDGTPSRTPRGSTSPVRGNLLPQKE